MGEDGDGGREEKKKPKSKEITWKKKNVKGKQGKGE